MSQTIQSGLTDVTGTVQTTAATTAITHFIYAQQAGAGTQTLGTVGAGKRWLIISIDLSVGTAGGNGANGYVTLNGEKAAYCYPQSSVGSSFVEHANLVFSPSACPILTAGQTVQLVSAAAITSNACVGYIEESV